MQTQDPEPSENRVRRMIEALPALIAKIREEGYEIVDVAQMFGIAGATTEEPTRVKEA
jgi:DNA-binding IclR family transcriptional regulator